MRFFLYPNLRKEREKLKKYLNSKGESYPLICTFILVIMMIFSVIFTYSAVITKVNVMKSNTEIVFDSFVANNSIRIFANIKQGNNAMEGIDDTEFQKSIKKFCMLELSGGMLYSNNAEGEEQYHITVPVIEYTEDGKLELKVSYTMYIPVHFAGAKIATARIPVKITSALQNKTDSETSTEVTTT